MIHVLYLWFIYITYPTIAEGCYFDRKVDELDKAIAVAARDPSWYGIDETEIENRRRWTGGARTQVHKVLPLFKKEVGRSRKFCG